VFLNRHAGTQILHALMQGAKDARHYPPRGEITFSLTQLARDFHVSRPHVARMLRAAEKAGLLVLVDSNRLHFTEEGVENLTKLLVARLGADLQAAIGLGEELDARETLRKTG
jgi:DNA-binding MarR family transcriptional regulator